MGSKRLERMASFVVREISDILRRKISDPRLGWVTITRASITPDLREARIYFTTLEAGDARTQALAGLQHAEGYIRRELGQRLETRVTPALHFVIDDRQEAVDRVQALLKTLESKGGTPDGGTDPGA